MRDNYPYHLWWMHDAQWYQEVANEFGFEVANRLNKKILIYMAKRVAKQLLLRSRKRSADLSVEEKIELFMQAAKVMWPEELVCFTHKIMGKGDFEVDTQRNFALFMLEQAGCLDKYDCPCLELRQAWFEGLGIEVEENRKVSCVREGGGCCRFRTKLKEPEIPESVSTKPSIPLSTRHEESKQC